MPLLEALMFFCVIGEPPLARAAALAKAALAAENAASSFSIQQADNRFGSQSSLNTRSDGAADDAALVYTLGAAGEVTRRHGSAGFRVAASASAATVSGSRSAPTSIIDFNDPLYGGSLAHIPSAWADHGDAGSESLALSVRQRLRLLLQLAPYMLPLGGVYFFEYLVPCCVLESSCFLFLTRCLLLSQISLCRSIKRFFLLFISTALRWCRA